MREMRLSRPYFELVADGRKTVEVRVLSPKVRGLAAGDLIRFVCGQDQVLTRVVRVAPYADFEELLDAEGVERVNPDAARDEQLDAVRRIYPPEKEALGVLAIEIERVRP